MAGSMLYKGSDLQFIVCSLDLHLKEGNQRMGVGKGASRGMEQVSEVRSSTALREHSGGNQRGLGKEPLASRE